MRSRTTDPSPTSQPTSSLAAWYSNDSPIAPMVQRVTLPYEARLAETFVELADTLIDDFDVIEFLHVLTGRCVELLEASAAGLMLADSTAELRVMASSSERARLLEL